MKNIVKNRYLNIRRCHRIGEIHDKFSKLFYIDDILGVLGVGVDNFSTAGDLMQRRLLKWF
jgi:hypothetical protein